MHISSVLIGGIWLASAATAAPAYSYLESCVNSVSTVYVTVTSSSSIASSQVAVTTVYLTVYSTCTIVELELPTAIPIRGAAATSSFSTLGYSGLGPQGWNTSSGAHLLPGTGIFSPVSLVSSGFATKDTTASVTSTSAAHTSGPVMSVPTFPLISIYETSQSAILTSSFTILYGHTTIPILAPTSATSAESQEWTTAVINGITVSWGPLYIESSVLESSSFSLPMSAISCTDSLATKSSISTPSFKFPSASYLPGTDSTSSASAVTAGKTSPSKSSVSEVQRESQTETSTSETLPASFLKTRTPTMTSPSSHMSSEYHASQSGTQGRNQTLASTSQTSTGGTSNTSTYNVASKFPHVSSDLQTSSSRSQTQNQKIPSTSQTSVSSSSETGTPTKSSTTLIILSTTQSSTALAPTQSSTSAITSQTPSRSASESTISGSSTNPRTSSTIETLSPKSQTQSPSLFTKPSTSSSSASNTTSSTPSSTPTLCGENGDFTLTFDDIPPLAINNSTDPNTVQPEPIFSPYHKFDFSDGFTVSPPPTDPYLPSSKPLLLEFIPNFNANTSNPQVGPNAGDEGWAGQITPGDYDQTGCFSFNMYGADFGCDSKGPDCIFTFSGYRIDRSKFPFTYSKITSETHVVPACPALKDCSLVSVGLGDSFRNLSYVRIGLTAAGKPKIWWMDDLRLGWFDNSCKVSVCRQTQHVH